MIKVKKPFTNKDEEANLLSSEKFVLKDNVNGIVRHTRETLEAKSCWIEGDGSGMMGAKGDWPQIPFTHKWYKERMELQYSSHIKNQLKRRL